MKRTRQLTRQHAGRGGAQTHELRPDFPASARRRRLLRLQRRLPSRLPRRLNAVTSSKDRQAHENYQVKNIMMRNVGEDRQCAVYHDWLAVERKRLHCSRRGREVAEL